MEDKARFKSRLHLRGWLGSTPEGRRPQIRGFRAGGSLAVASSTPATPLLSRAKIVTLDLLAMPIGLTHQWEAHLFTLKTGERDRMSSSSRARRMRCVIDLSKT